MIISQRSLLVKDSASLGKRPRHWASVMQLLAIVSQLLVNCYVTLLLSGDAWQAWRAIAAAGACIDMRRQII
jgi:hypothetical protein